MENGTIFAFSHLLSSLLIILTQQRESYCAETPGCKRVNRILINYLHLRSVNTLRTATRRVQKSVVCDVANAGTFVEFTNNGNALREYR